MLQSHHQGYSSLVVGATGGSHLDAPPGRLYEYIASHKLNIQDEFLFQGKMLQSHHQGYSSLVVGATGGSHLDAPPGRLYECFCRIILVPGDDAPASSPLTVLCGLFYPISVILMRLERSESRRRLSFFWDNS
jgi:hypothetical protein